MLANYAPVVKTIEQIRLENYKRLVADLERDLGRPPRQIEVAAELGISKVYVHQLEKGKRQNIDSAAARKMEEAAEKEVGWMDHDHDLWPFQSIGVDRYRRMPLEWRGIAEKAYRDVLAEWESSKEPKRADGAA